MRDNPDRRDAAMKMHIEERPTYLHVIFDGDIDIKQAKEFTTQVLETCGKLRTGNVLMDMRNLRGKPTTMGRWEYAQDLSDQYLKFIIEDKLVPLKLAILGKEPVIDPGRLGETMARNRGMQVKVTSNETDAYAWLEVDPEDERREE
jgi:hypothetical protein